MNGRKCPSCGAELVRKRFPSGLEDRRRFETRIYCDRKCMALGMVKDDPTLAAHRWRAAKLRGDRCAECGRPEELHAHHIDRDPANNSPDNVVTLCASCHLLHHWRTDKKNRPRASCRICGDPARGHRLCNKHYARWKKYGDPLLTRRKVGTEWVLLRDTD